MAKYGNIAGKIPYTFDCWVLSNSLKPPSWILGKSLLSQRLFLGKISRGVQDGGRYHVQFVDPQASLVDSS